MFVSASSQPTDLGSLQPSGGHYDSLFNLDDGLLVAESNSSPENEQHDWKEEQYPPLRKWSDVISLLWIDAAGSKAANLKHVIRSVVTNRETLSVMRRAVGEGEFDEKFQDWGKFDPIDTNGRTFRPSEDAFYALLYTPNGRGIGWSLIQHKAQLGIKTVSEITVFGANDSPMLYFKIDDVSLMDQVQG